MNNQKSLLRAGLSANEAKQLATKLSDYANLDPEAKWHAITKNILNIVYPFPVHQYLYQTTYPNWEKIPAPAWFPDKEWVSTTNIGKLMAERKFNLYGLLNHWSITLPDEFWETTAKLLAIQFDQPYSVALDSSSGVTSTRWFVGSKLNIVNSCLTLSADIAIIEQDHQGRTNKISYQALKELVNRIANSLKMHITANERIALAMPMSTTSIAIFLAIIKSGCTAVPISDSLSAKEIAELLQTLKINIVFTQENITPDKKIFTLYDKIVQADPALAIVLKSSTTTQHALRQQDIAFEDFLVEDSECNAVSCSAEDVICILAAQDPYHENILVPWNHITPIKCGSDAYFHLNVQAGDILCMPANLDSTLGICSIFASFLNKATLAIYCGLLTEKPFGDFIAANRVTLLGIHPKIANAWRISGNLDKCDFSKIKLLASTGKYVTIEDNLYLMARTGYRPIVVYHPYADLAGIYITNSIAQPIAPGACNTSALGLTFVIIDKKGALASNGEAALVPPSIGLSNALINKNNAQIYYAGMPKSLAFPCLRRQGDHIAAFPNNFYCLQK